MRHQLKPAQLTAPSAVAWLSSIMPAINGWYGVHGCVGARLNVDCDGWHTRDTGWDDLRYLCQEFFLIDYAIRASIEFGITIEQQDGQDHDASPVISDQWFPCSWAQCDRIKETGRPI